MPGAASIRWSAPPSAMANRADGYAERLLEAVFQICETHAQLIADDARVSAPWQDRTGNARSGLHGTATRQDAGAGAKVAYSVAYGVFLERKNAGRFATVVPALQRGYAPLMSDIKALIS